MCIRDRTFTENNWNTAQTVTLTGVNDTDSDRHQAYQISLTGVDPATGNSKSTAVALHNLDDDTNVTVALASSDTGEGTVNPATLTFTEDNWNIAQTVTLTGVDDTDLDRHQDYEIELSTTDSVVDGSVIKFDGVNDYVSVNGLSLSLIHI